MPKLRMRPTLKEMVIKEKKYRAMEKVIEAYRETLLHYEYGTHIKNMLALKDALKALSALEKEGGV